MWGLHTRIPRKAGRGKQEQLFECCSPNDNPEEKGQVSIPSRCFPLGFNFGVDGRVLQSPVLRIWEVVSRLPGK